MALGMQHDGVNFDIQYVCWEDWMAFAYGMRCLTGHGGDTMQTLGVNGAIPIGRRDRMLQAMTQRVATANVTVQEKYFLNDMIALLWYAKSLENPPVAVPAANLPTSATWSFAVFLWLPKLLKCLVQQFGLDLLTYASDLNKVVRSTRVPQNRQPGLIPVEFRLERAIAPSEKLYVVGNIVALGKWHPLSGKQLIAKSNLHSVIVNIHQNEMEIVEFKYVLIESTGNIVWETGDNRRLGRPDLWRR